MAGPWTHEDLTSFSSIFRLFTRYTCCGHIREVIYWKMLAKLLWNRISFTYWLNSMISRYWVIRWIIFSFTTPRAYSENRVKVESVSVNDRISQFNLLFPSGRPWISKYTQLAQDYVSQDSILSTVLLYNVHCTMYVYCVYSPPVPCVY